MFSTSIVAFRRDVPPGRLYTRLWIVIDHDDSMDVIGHHHPRIDALRLPGFVLGFFPSSRTASITDRRKDHSVHD